MGLERKPQSALASWAKAKLGPELETLPPTTEKVMHVFLSCDSTDFILIDFRLLDYL